MPQRSNIHLRKCTHYYQANLDKKKRNSRSGRRDANWEIQTEVVCTNQCLVQYIVVGSMWNNYDLLYSPLQNGISLSLSKWPYLQ